jgi:hypothetical protein
MSSKLPSFGGSWWFCLLVGPGLFLNGLLGLVFGGREFAVGGELPHSEFNFFFEFNGWHHVLHVVTAGILVVGVLRPRFAPAAALAFGAIYALLTPLAFLDGDDVTNVVFSDSPDNFVHLTLALIGSAAGLIALRGAEADSSPT